METKYEMIYKGKGEVDFIINDADVTRYLDDKIQENELYANGTLCYSCGELNENLIGDDKILKTAPGTLYICDKCEGEMKDE